MSRYRISSDKTFLPKTRHIEYANQYIYDVSVWFVYHIKDKRTGNEVFFDRTFFDSDFDIDKLPIQVPLDTYSRCMLNEQADNGYTMIPTAVVTFGDYEVTFTVDGYYKSYTMKGTAVQTVVQKEITEDEFTDIVKNNIDKFCSAGKLTSVQTVIAE